MRIFGQEVQKCESLPGFMQRHQRKMDERIKGEQTYLEEVDAFLTQRLQYMDNQLENFDKLVEKRNN
jgi:hypothetical protein